ncbi:metalloregulator ArsR/SmtB family transcription factor [Gordonia sp. SID5947]|uniref:ArsR/SmtB family transcription factor n=1 Tax=Gordonia sp. SID5947 TaxID=2690315 RepID=UPI0031BB7D2C
MATNGSGIEPWDILADASRRQILAALSKHPSPVGELADQLPISRPAVSQHLRVLKAAGVVIDVEHGTRRVYHVDAAALSALKDQLDTFWQRTLTGFGDTVATSVDKEKESDDD